MRHTNISSNERANTDEKVPSIGYKEKLISNRKWLALYYTLKESDKHFLFVMSNAFNNSIYEIK